MKELAPGLFQLRGFPPNGINVYLMEDVLVDAATKRAGRRILGQLEGKPLSMVALTHVHPDHQGVAKAVCESRGVPLACHSADVDAMEGRKPVQQKRPDHPINRLFHKLMTGPPHKVDRVLADGDEVAGFRVIHAPGHSPGEVIYFRESDRAAIVGDVVNCQNVFTGVPGLREPPEIFSLDPVENRRSIRKLAELEPSLICAGHGAPWRDMEKFQKFVDQLPGD